MSLRDDEDFMRRVREYVKEVVAQSPPLTDEQRELIRVLLPPPRPRPLDLPETTEEAPDMPSPDPVDAPTLLIFCDMHPTKKANLPRSWKLVTLAKRDRRWMDETPVSSRIQKMKDGGALVPPSDDHAVLLGVGWAGSIDELRTYQVSCLRCEAAARHGAAYRHNVRVKGWKLIKILDAIHFNGMDRITLRGLTQAVAGFDRLEGGK